MTVTKSGGLLDQYKLLGAVIDADWATRLDHKVARHVIDRYYIRHGNGRASLRELQRWTGALRPNIIASLRRLVSQGVFSVARRGIGTRSTEYLPNFEFSAKSSSGIADSTSTSGIIDDTSTGTMDDTSTASSGIADDTESYLRSRSTDRLTVSRNNAAPLPGLVPGPGAVEQASKQGGPSGGFDELWTVYPRKHHRARARLAYAKLAPDPELHERLVTVASAWAAHYETAGTLVQWRPHLHNWLADEKYLEDLPVAYENSKSAAIAKAIERGPKMTKGSTNDSTASGLTPKTPIGRHVVEIVSFDLIEDKSNYDMYMDIRHRILGGKRDGEEFTNKFAYLNSGGTADEGAFVNILKATGKPNAQDTSELLGAVLCAVVSRFGKIQYEAISPLGGPAQAAERENV